MFICSLNFLLSGSQILELKNRISVCEVYFEEKVFLFLDLVVNGNIFLIIGLDYSVASEEKHDDLIEHRADHLDISSRTFFKIDFGYMMV